MKMKELEIHFLRTRRQRHKLDDPKECRYSCQKVSHIFLKDESEFIHHISYELSQKLLYEAE